MQLDKEMESFKKTICLLDRCIDDYLFVLDIKEDVYFISPHAKKRFKIENNIMIDSLENLKLFVYYKDYDELVIDLNEIISGQKDYHNMQYRWIGKDDIPIWINCRGKTLYDHQHQARYLIGCINEIGKKQAADNASGLLGELSFRKLILPLEDDLKTGFILRLGIDDFKNINENFGTVYGDKVLKETAQCIKKYLREYQRLYKIVADEFIIFDPFGSKEDALELYNHIQETLINYIETINYEVYFTVSGGLLCLNNYPTCSYSEIMKWSEFSLNRAKKKSKNTLCIFDKQDYLDAQRKIRLTRVLRKAIIHQFSGFEVHYQPIIEVNTQKLSSVEALLRFHCVEFGNVSPGEFIPLLEESDLIIPVGKWVLQQALNALNILKKDIPEIKIHVNLSYVQVLKSNALKDILHIIQQYEINHHQLIIELTESGFVESDETFISFCQKLRKNNIQLALDDFGTGYSNFHYLYHLKPDYIKIDRNLMKNAFLNDYENMLLKHMVEMAHSVDVKICIEGVETKDELDKIMKMKPDYIQGFYYGRPCSLDKLLENMK